MVESSKIWDSLPLSSQATEVKAGPVPPLNVSTVQPSADALTFVVALLSPLVLQECFNSLSGMVESKGGRGRHTKRQRTERILHIHIHILNMNIPGQCLVPDPHSCTCPVSFRDVLQQPCEEGYLDALKYRKHLPSPSYSSTSSNYRLTSRAGLEFL